MELPLIVAAVVIVIGVVATIRDRRKRMERLSRLPPRSLDQAVRPDDTARMQPGVEYCWVSFMGDWGKTEVTFYGGLLKRRESFDDKTGFGARDFGRKLERKGWTLVAETSHKEGHEAYFERRKS